MEALSLKALEAYAHLFSNLLSYSHIKALVALFGWTLPKNVEDMDNVQMNVGFGP